MTIKKRLAISNVLMIVVPIIITVLIAICCIGVLWWNIARGTGLGFEDSEDFYQASAGISQIAAEALESHKDTDKINKLNAMSSFLDRGAMSLIVTRDGADYYQYGTSVDPDTQEQLQAAAQALDNDGTISSGNYNLCVTQQSYDGETYVIYLYNVKSELSYTSLKVATVIAGSILILTIFLSIFFTDRFLTRFIFRHVEEPLELLSAGVQEISNGNLDYRLDYHSEDEFLPICNSFNDMAVRLKESEERSRREDESRKELMASISHDLRSPLTSIQAYVEGLLDGVAKTPEMQKRYLTTIKAKSEELEQMVAHILAYSRLDMNSTVHEPETLQLDEYLKAGVETLAADYAARGLDIELQAAAFTVSADKTELQQMLVNLMDNSLKYKEKSRAKLKIELIDCGSYGLLSFTDDGPGVPADAVPKLFDVFYRADPARTDRTKGSGLGLAIVEKTVQRMGGTVHAENAEGGGLAIIITLPKGEH